MYLSKKTDIVQDLTWKNIAKSAVCQAPRSCMRIPWQTALLALRPRTVVAIPTRRRTTVWKVDCCCVKLLTHIHCRNQVASHYSLLLLSVCLKCRLQNIWNQVAVCNILLNMQSHSFFYCITPRRLWFQPHDCARRPCMLDGVRRASVPQGDRNCRAKREGRVEEMCGEM